MKKRYPYRKKSSFKKYIIFTLLAMLLIAVYAVELFNISGKEIVLAVVEQEAVTKANEAIDSSLNEVNKKYDLNYEKFFVKTSDNENMTNSLTVNTILINEICSNLSVDISQELKNYGVTVVKVPYSTIFNIDILANIGAKFPISVLPVGKATVDYETKFEAVGINQINFELWLKINSHVRVVNPLSEREVIVTRKVALVNTVFSGKIPNSFYQNQPVPYLK